MLNSAQLRAATRSPKHRLVQTPAASRATRVPASQRPGTVLGIDIGGSSIKGALVDTARGRIVAETFRLDTPEKLSPRQMGAAIATIARRSGWNGPIGVGMPGIVHSTKITLVANLHREFNGCDVVRVFSEEAGCPVAVTNDAAAAGMAEMTFGAGRSCTGKVLIITLGTGVGSALAYRGVVMPCEFGQLRWKGKPAEVRVAASVRERRNLSWAEWGGRLRDYVALLEDVLWPEMIVIGGGVSANHRQFFKYIQARARLVPAEFFNGAGIIGAALWGATAAGER